MYDLHNHLLPGIDDGAQNIESALELAQIAVKDGITHMVCTPHIHLGRYNNTVQTIQAAYNDLKQALIEQKIPLTIAFAAEVRIGPEILQLAIKKALPFIGKYDGMGVLLLEFPTNSIPLGSDKLISWLLKQNIKPMIAHPERNLVFQEHPERLDAFLKQGCLTQVTGNSFLGSFGNGAQNLAIRLLENSAINIVASDAHNSAYRPPVLSNAFSKVSELSSLEVANNLFQENPKTIAQTKFIEAV